jgi:hypothetical protein
VLSDSFSTQQAKASTQHLESVAKGKYEDAKTKHDTSVSALKAADVHLQQCSMLAERLGEERNAVLRTMQATSHAAALLATDMEGKLLISKNENGE